MTGRNPHRWATQRRGGAFKQLRSQLIRAVMSIAANLIEGSRKESRREFGRFVGYSIDSAVEAVN